MVNGLNTNDNILNHKTIGQQQEISKLGVSTAKNPYAKQNFLVDQGDISNQAIDLYQKDKDISQFKNLVMSGSNSEEELTKISQFISNDDLSQAMLDDQEFLNSIF